MKKWENGVRELTNWELLCKFKRISLELQKLQMEKGEKDVANLKGSYEYDTFVGVAEAMYRRSAPQGISTVLQFHYELVNYKNNRTLWNWMRLWYLQMKCVLVMK